MRTALLLPVAALALVPARASAQRANRSISLESSLSTPARAPGAGVALGASWWLEGDVHATARLGWTSAGEPGGRAVDGTFGVAWAPGTARIRPRVFAEAGWSRRVRPRTVEGRLSLGAGAGLEWFVEREVAITAGVAVRRAHLATVELFGGVRAGF